MTVIFKCYLQGEDPVTFSVLLNTIISYYRIGSFSSHADCVSGKLDRKYS